MEYAVGVLVMLALVVAELLWASKRRRDRDTGARKPGNPPPG